MKKDIELLAPAGSMESLKAAIKSGANAVYLGGSLFNARQHATNFNNKELEEAIRFAHLNDTKIYVTVNILIDDEEIEDVIDYIRFLYEIDVDAVIVQDLGLASLIRQVFPKLNIHGSTQMTINNLPGVKKLEELGFTRVVLARETPLEEIRHIKDNTSIELEYFIHGALCVSYSGQCLMSSLIGGRSGNRGNCAQPCRRPYSIVDDGRREINKIGQGYLLSPKDLNTLDNLDQIIGAGITSLKIEGRMKRPEYVSVAVRSYSKAIKNGIEGISQQDRKDLEQIFNRGFTRGIGLGDFGKNFTTIDRPDNRGILLGKVIRADKYKVYLELEEDLHQGDGVEFQLSNGEYKGIRSPYDGKKGDRIHFEKPGYILKDSLVYKTSSVDLLSRAKASSEEEVERKPIHMEVDIHIGKNPRLTLKYEDHIIETTVAQLVEKGLRVSLDEEKVLEQLSKLGSTAYYLDEVKINLEEGSYLPVSILNQLRREAVDRLDNIRGVYNPRKAIDGKEYNRSKEKLLNFCKKEMSNKKKLSIMVDNREQYDQLDLNKLDRIYLGFHEDIKQILIDLKEKGKEAYLWTDKILYNKDLKELDRVIDPIKDLLTGVSVSNLGTLKHIDDNYQLKIHCDMGLNIFNSHTVRTLNDFGIQSMTLSPELNLSQITNINRNISTDLEAIVYGYLPAMITKTCPMALIKGCKNDKGCKTCEYANGYGLRDRLNIDFYMSRKEGFTSIYNSVPIMVLDSVDEILKSGVSTLRLDFTLENKNISRLQSIFYDYINGNVDNIIIRDFVDDFRQDNSITNGHYFRGIM